MSQTPALELELDHDYEGIPVLRNISLSLEEGEHLAVLGPSGCGKSTLLRLVTGLERPSRGRVLRRGEDITGTTGHFGFMHQQDLLLPWKRLWENAALPLLLKGTPRAEARKAVEERLAVVGLEGFADHYPYQLSGGMRQRAAFLRTWLSSRDLLLLDEPFAALDVLLRAQLQEWLVGMLARENAALVLVTHSVDEALLLADRVVVLSSAPGTVVLAETVTFARAPFADKPYLSEFLAMKRRILDVLLTPGSTGG